GMSRAVGQKARRTSTLTTEHVRHLRFKPLDLHILDKLWWAVRRSVQSTEIAGTNILETEVQEDNRVLRSADRTVRLVAARRIDASVRQDILPLRLHSLLIKKDRIEGLLIRDSGHLQLRAGGLARLERLAQEVLNQQHIASLVGSHWADRRVE